MGMPNQVQQAGATEAALLEDAAGSPNSLKVGAKQVIPKKCRGGAETIKR